MVKLCNVLDNRMQRAKADIVIRNVSPELQGCLRTTPLCRSLGKQSVCIQVWPQAFFLFSIHILPGYNLGDGLTLV